MGQVFKDYFAEVLGREGFSLVPFLSRPLSRGTVTLASTDPFSHPLIDPNYFSHPNDVITLVRGQSINVSHNLSNAFQETDSKWV